MLNKYLYSEFFILLILYFQMFMEYFESLAWKDYFYTYLAATYSVIQTNLLVLIILVYRLSTGKLKPMHKLVLSVTVVAMLRGLLVLPVRTHHQRHKWTTSESLCRAFIGMDILLYSTYQVIIIYHSNLLFVWTV